MDELIQRIYETRSVVGRSGKVHYLHSEVDHEEGALLFNTIRDDLGIVKTLEVGCGFGLSSLHICKALSSRTGASHTIIDPFQTTQWDGVGVKHLEEAGIRFFNLVEAKSEFALPRILEQGEGRFDFIFIDGWHTFDHTLLDCFYATRLLRVGGYLAIDDVIFNAVRRVIDFLLNYPCYELFRSLGSVKSRSWERVVARTLLSLMSARKSAELFSRKIYRRIFEDTDLRMVVLKKISEDRRSWDWHDDTF
jgi:predicted O-methyltransferase YrrM